MREEGHHALTFALPGECAGRGTAREGVRLRGRRKMRAQGRARPPSLVKTGPGTAPETARLREIAT